MADRTIDEMLPRSSTPQRVATLLAVSIPFLGVIGAVCCVWGWGFSWPELASLLLMYFATGFGTTVGYHRLFSHRSFETHRPVRFLLSVLGAMSVQGPVLKWVSVHRRHHHHSDETGDPHSPHHYGGGIRGVLAGLWHAQVGWMFTADHPDLADYVRDLQVDPGVRFTSRWFSLWVVIGLLIPTALGGYWTGTWAGALLGFVWGGPVRVFLVQHATWSVNSICHLWGSQPYRSHDESRNNLLCGLLALGEGFHNAHHAFPTSARHGLRWWEIDLSYMVIRIMQLVGLAWRVRVPSTRTVAAKRIDHPA